MKSSDNYKLTAMDKMLLVDALRAAKTLKKYIETEDSLLFDALIGNFYAKVNFCVEMSGMPPIISSRLAALNPYDCKKIGLVKRPETYLN